MYKATQLPTDCENSESLQSRRQGKKAYRAQQKGIIFSFTFYWHFTLMSCFIVILCNFYLYTFWKNFDIHTKQCFYIWIPNLKHIFISKTLSLLNVENIRL